MKTMEPHAERLDVEAGELLAAWKVQHGGDGETGQSSGTTFTEFTTPITTARDWLKWPKDVPQHANYSPVDLRGLPEKLSDAMSLLSGRPIKMSVAGGA